jgi:hypothetical protein
MIFIDIVWKRVEGRTGRQTDRQTDSHLPITHVLKKIIKVMCPQDGLM